MIYLLCVIFAVIILILGVRLFFLQKSLREIDRELEEIFSQSAGTNALLTVSSGDRHIRRLARQLNKQLKKLRREQLRYENGDRELKESITNISHDLRTPLTSISGYLDLLQKELTLSEAISHSIGASVSTENSLRYLEIIQNRTEAMKQLTEELFRYSIALSVREENPVPLSLNRVLEESLIAFCGDLEQRGITPVISMPEEPVAQTLDEASLNRVFGNIIGNAVKYSGGDLRVTLTPEGTVTFCNIAPGLTPLDVAKLFDRFFTVETVAASGRTNSKANQTFPTHSGNPRSEAVPAVTSASEPCGGMPGSTGLGLSIARLLTERMGGSIDAEYKNGELYITVQFPA